MKNPPHSRLTPFWLMVLIVVQSACAVFFFNDSAVDIFTIGLDSLDTHIVTEMLASIVLVIGVVVETSFLLRMLRRQAHMARGLEIASGALQHLIEGYYKSWALTAAEQDVASFTLKGFSIAEIASFRGSAEGTIKAHLNSIYRKSGVSGRTALVSLLLEDLMGGVLLDQEKVV